MNDLLGLTRSTNTKVKVNKNKNSLLSNSRNPESVLLIELEPKEALKLWRFLLMNETNTIMMFSLALVFLNLISLYTV